MSPSASLVGVVERLRRTLHGTMGRAKGRVRRSGEMRRVFIVIDVLDRVAEAKR